MSKKNEVKMLTDAGAAINAKILSLEKGLIEYNDVQFIRIISKEYNIIIMKDYLPIIGEIKGRIEFVRVNNVVKLEKIVGYFIHKHNEFKLFIKEEKND